MNQEQARLEQQRRGQADWRLWGPYLSERAWGTVREDYSPHGNAWEHFDHDQSRSRAYRWNEDGLGGISDSQQRLCFALALWNGKDPILKERAFGLTGNQGNHGEDVKECYFYTDATPSHSWLRYLYKYPQNEYPYSRLVEENGRRSRHEPPFGLLDSGAFAENRYFDVDVQYAKQGDREIHIRIEIHNRGPESAEISVLPSLWFRNDWSWSGDAAAQRPRIRAASAGKGGAWALQAEHPTLGSYQLYGRAGAELLFTENESNTQRLWGVGNDGAYTKDAFHRRVVDGDVDAVNPAGEGSKAAAWYRLAIPAGGSKRIELVLSAAAMKTPFLASDAVFEQRQVEADAFYAERLLGADAEEKSIARQAFAGMIWSKQFFHFDVERWLEGDALPPPGERRRGRNASWRHLKAADVISMPDKWEYPWFAAWDLAFHCISFAPIDVDFAKDQLELVLNERYLHPNGQIPAYEWAFGDTNPPVHAMAALKVFRTEREQRGVGDRDFLQRVFHKMLLNYTWWINRKDSAGHNVFEGGFLGLDNISVFDRSHPLPEGFSLKQADATGWMAMFSLNLTLIALELAVEDSDYEGIAIHTYNQFLAIANAISGHIDNGLALWDAEDGFFKDLVTTPDGQTHRVDVFSWVGLIPLFACEVVDERLLANVPAFRTVLGSHAGGFFRGNIVCACPHTVNERGEHLLSLVNQACLPAILKRLLDEDEFLSPYGVRGVSRQHAERRDLGLLPGIGQALIEYVPGESNSGLFGGNSNWRGPVWMPTNFALVQSLQKFQRYLGDDFTVSTGQPDAPELSLGQVGDLISDRLLAMFRRDDSGRRPCMPVDGPYQHDPHWRDLVLFWEYFHGDSGVGLGAAHQTGWTGLVANLILQRHGMEATDFYQAPLAPTSVRASPAEIRQ